jgi:hypothetical protein
MNPKTGKICISDGVSTIEKFKNVCDIVKEA